MRSTPRFFCFFFFNDTATTEIYTLSLHDALPIWASPVATGAYSFRRLGRRLRTGDNAYFRPHRPVSGERCGKYALSPVRRSEEHTSELQSHLNLVCRLLLEKKTHNFSYNSSNRIT